MNNKFPVLFCHRSPCCEYWGFHTIDSRPRPRRRAPRPCAAMAYTPNFTFRLPVLDVATFHTCARLSIKVHPPPKKKKDKWTDSQRKRGVAATGVILSNSGTMIKRQRPYFYYCLVRYDGLVSGRQRGRRGGAGEVRPAHHPRGLVLLAVMDPPAVKFALGQVLLCAHAEEVVHPVPVCWSGRYRMEA